MAEQSDPQSSDQGGIPAATVVIFRHGRKGEPPQILMQVRNRNLAFAGGMAVFPGGRVDPADHALAATLDVSDADEAAHRVAVVRMCPPRDRRTPFAEELQYRRKVGVPPSVIFSIVPQCPTVQPVVASSIWMDRRVFPLV